MAPVEDLQSRDLAWISDFVMQQMVIMMRPMMDHLQETEATADYANRVVQRLGVDVSELRGDLERTNKYLGILRQGLGVQNEGKFIMQRTVEGNVRAAKRLDEQMESTLAIIRGLEDSIGQIIQDVRLDKDKQDELAKHININNNTVEDLQAKVERLTIDSHALKNDFMANDARMEIWQRELRELRRGPLGVSTKMDSEKGARPPPSSQSSRLPQSADQSPWPPKKSFAPAVEPLNSKGNDANASLTGLVETSSNHSGSSHQSKRVSKVCCGSDPLEFSISAPPLSGPRAGNWNGFEGTRTAGLEGTRTPSRDANEGVARAGAADDEPQPSRLPMLAAARQSNGVARSADAGPRLRFHATMAKPESRGSQNATMGKPS